MERDISREARPHPRYNLFHTPKWQKHRGKRPHTLAPAAAVAATGAGACYFLAGTARKPVAVGARDGLGKGGPSKA